MEQQIPTSTGITSSAPTMDTNTKPTKSETSRLRRRLSIFGRNNSNHHPESSSISSPDTNTPITSNTPIESIVPDPI